jgi:hypothetical protein
MFLKKKQWIKAGVAVSGHLLLDLVVKHVIVICKNMTIQFASIKHRKKIG